MFRMILIFYLCNSFLMATLTFSISLNKNFNYLKSSDENNNFIEPESISNEADIFTTNGTEYIFVNHKVPNKGAQLLCRSNYQAELAIVDHLNLAKFLAEAISETNLFLDSLWLSARQYNATENWYWIRNNSKTVISQEIVDMFIYNIEVFDDDRLCLTLGRENHDLPQYRPLTCEVKRAFICERPQSDILKNSTHAGWIKIHKRYYKIFSELVDWNTAVGKCFEYDQDSTLAVLVSAEDSQNLGRYLLIGRPSLENAWTDGKFLDGNYKFEQEDKILSNVTATNNFPPWRNGKMQKAHGCLLLDRHLSNRTYFVEAPCDRLRPFICYKMAKEKKHHNDIIMGKYGYRVHYVRKNWQAARDFCKYKYEDYSSYLAEVREKVQVYHLLYVMGENRTTITHTWLGGRFLSKNKPPVWVWDSTQTVIPTDSDSLLNWVRNETFIYDVEKNNECLAMDRENHVVALHYGATCVAEHCFVCVFRAEDLQKLQKDELEDEDNDV